MTWTTDDYVHAFLERAAIAAEGGETEDGARKVATQTVLALVREHGGSPGVVLAEASRRQSMVRLRCG